MTASTLQFFFFFFLEETLIGYVPNLSHTRRNIGNTMNYCTFVLQTSAQKTQEVLLYSTTRDHYY